MFNLISPYRCLFCESGSVVLVFVHFYLFSIVAYAIRHRQTDALRVMLSPHHSRIVIGIIHLFLQVAHFSFPETISKGELHKVIFIFGKLVCGGTD